MANCMVGFELGQFIFFIWKKLLKKLMSIFVGENELNQLRKRNALNALCFFFLRQVAIYYNDYYRCAWGEKKTNKLNQKNIKLFISFQFI